eukprot:SAG31_NODE_4985_length_2818_cov_4.900735_4_plen_48_part_01
MQLVVWQDATAPTCQRVWGVPVATKAIVLLARLCAPTAAAICTAASPQ